MLSEDFLKKVAKCGIVESVASFSRFKEDQMLKKQSGTKTTRKLDIPKLDDANFAGTRKRLNVRDVSRAAVIKNEEIKNLVQILGLRCVRGE